MSRKMEIRLEARSRRGQEIDAGRWEIKISPSKTIIAIGA